MTRTAAWTGSVLIVGLAFSVLYAWPSLAIVAGHGLDWPFYWGSEASTLTTCGKWWLAGQGSWLSDGFSGQFPTFYNYLSDLLLNALARLLNCPPMVAQVVVFGPLLGGLLPAVNFVVLARLMRDRMSAAVASLLISTAGGMGLLPLAGIDRASELRRLLHLPLDAIALGTAQSMGWLLLLPSVALLPLAHGRFTVTRAVAFGAVTGMLLQAHTLTFVNAVAAQACYLVATNLVERPWGDRRTRLWLGALAGVGIAFLGLAAFHVAGSAWLGALGGAGLVATFLVDPQKRLYLWGYGTTLLVSAPYLLVLARGPRDALPAIAQPTAVSPFELLLFFAVYLLAALPALRSGGDVVALRWALSLFLATALLAMNNLWGWGNHPYRFAIHLVFPVAVLAALGVRRSPPLLRAALLTVLAAASLLNLWSFWRGDRPYLQIVVEDASAPFLHALRAATSRPDAAGTLVLNPPEHNYPAGSTQNALLFNYSQRPGFIPDFRYLLGRERYHNRVGLFCFLFPDYPAYDTFYERRACAEALDPPRDVLVLRDLRLRSAVLPLYGIAYVAAAGRPFAWFLDRALGDYGWELVARSPGHKRFLHPTLASLDGVARFDRGRWDEAGLQVDFVTDEGGPHVVVLGGRRLEDRAGSIVVDGSTLSARSRSANWAVLETEIEAGRHRMELRWPSATRWRDPDYLYFAAVIAADRTAGLLDLPEPSNPALSSP